MPSDALQDVVKPVTNSEEFINAGVAPSLNGLEELYRANNMDP